MWYLCIWSWKLCGYYEVGNESICLQYTSYFLLDAHWFWCLSFSFVYTSKLFVYFHIIETFVLLWVCLSELTRIFRLTLSGRILSVVIFAWIFLNFLFDHHSFADGHLKCEGNYERVHFVEFAMIRSIDHSISKDFNPFLEILVKRRIDNFFVTSLVQRYKRKKNMMRINSYELILSPCYTLMWCIR